MTSSCRRCTPLPPRVLQWLWARWTRMVTSFPPATASSVAGLNGTGRFHIYTQQALVCLAQMARYLGDRATGAGQDLAAQALADFESRFG